MDERETLLARTKELGLNPHPNTGIEKLKAAIANAAAGPQNSGSQTGPEPERVEVLVLSPLKHNGRNYGPGTDNPMVALTQAECAALEALKVVQPASSE